MFKLEDVMDKETFKKAKEILQRFDPDKLGAIEVSNGSDNFKFMYFQILVLNFLIMHNINALFISYRSSF